MAIIDLSNYATTLTQADDNTGTNGNVWFDPVAGTIQFFTVTQQATVDLSAHGGGATDPNPLIELDGIKFEAIYAFENQERKTDEALRKYNRWTSGTFKFGGAYNFIFGRYPLAAADVALIRGSGWNEYNADNTTVLKIYFGNKGLSNIEPTSLPYYQLESTQFTTAIEYQKAGQIDEAVLVYVDGGDNNTLDPEVVSIRTYGFNYDRKSTIADLGIAELGGYSTGFAVNESPHLTTGSYALVDVYGGAQVAPFTGLDLEKLAVAQNEIGFVPNTNDGNTTAGDFTWVLKNTAATKATLNECVAYLDALGIQTVTINTGTPAVVGKDVNVWYSYDGAGNIVTQTGNNDGFGLYIDALAGDDRNAIVFVDDNGFNRIYPSYITIRTDVGVGAVADIESWYQNYFLTAPGGNFNAAGAVTVLDASGTAVKTVVGNTISDDTPYALSGSIFSYAFDFNADTLGGSGVAGTTKNMVMVVEGDGAVTQAKTGFTVDGSTTTVNVTCSPATEQNV